MFSILDTVRLKSPVVGDSPLQGERELDPGSEGVIIRDLGEGCYEVEFTDHEWGIPIAFAAVHEELLQRLSA